MGRNVPEDSVVAMVDGLLARAVMRRASDVHFEPQEDGIRIRYRLDGLLQDVDRLPASVSEMIVGRLKVMAGLLTYRVDVPQEGALKFTPAEGQSGIPMRVATFPTVRGERAVVRLLYGGEEVSSLDGLGLASPAVTELKRAAGQPQGLILVTGPAGSGKSTTLYALARHILDTTTGRSVVSLEDPVEQRVAGMTQIQISPYGELDYLRAMRSLLRQDVQVLLVGEIRDADTAHIVVQAALTGHLIMSTLHSGDPGEAIARLLEMGIAPYQVVGALSVVCSQRLVRVVCTDCRGSGCETCARTGYRGRTACGQVAVVDEALRELVLERAPAGRLRECIGGRCPPLLADAHRHVDAGRTRRDELLRVFGAD
jgi:general secretion pathway protein E